MTVTLRLTIEEAETLQLMANAAWEETDMAKILPGLQRKDGARAVRVIDKLAASIKRAKAKTSGESE